MVAKIAQPRRERTGDRVAFGSVSGLIFKLTSNPSISKLCGVHYSRASAMSISTSQQRQTTYPDLAGRVAVVTGGSRGIGAATGRALAANGALVALIARDQAALAAQAEAISATGGRALAVPADCTAPEQ